MTSTPPLASFFTYDDSPDLKESTLLILRFTRNWIHYGYLLHIFLLAVVAAAQGLLHHAG